MGVGPSAGLPVAAVPNPADSAVTATQTLVPSPVRTAEAARAASAAAEARRAAESATAAAGLVGLSCVISARGEVRTTPPRPRPVSRPTHIH